MTEAKTSNTTQTTQSAAHHKDVDRRHQLDIRLVQDVFLIWLNGNIDDINNDCLDIVKHLRREIYAISLFGDAEECIDFLGDIQNEKACMIISGSLSRQIVPLVHNMPQVDSIFIICDNKKDHEGWVKDWSKIKGVFTEIGPMCAALKHAVQQCEQNTIPISIIDRDDDSLERSRDRLDPSFMYTQIMKEIFLTITFEQKHIDEFIEYCREMLADNKKQLEYVDEFSRKYDEHTPIWWYTFEFFLYTMLNRTLRTMDTDLMIKLGFFISDLHRHIEQLHQEQFGSNNSKQAFTVYRGQGMDKGTFEKMVTNKGGLISFNSFLSTSKNREVSLMFVDPAPTDVQLVSVLFVINIDPTRSSIPFASVKDVGNFGDEEDEVLFSMNAVFRIGEITPLDDNARLVQVQLNLASDKDNDLRQLIDYTRKETFPDEEGWFRLGQVLHKMGKHAKAKQVYEMLLRQGAEEIVKGAIYNQLGVMHDEQGEYAEAIAYFERSVQIEKQISHEDLNFASYNNIGEVYRNMGDYPKALSSYEKALAIKQKSLPPTHPSLANSYNNIGAVYFSTGDYPKALSSYEKALAIRQQSLPPTHPDLAISYNNIGNVYHSMGDYMKALSSYEKALVISQQSLPSTHPNLAASYNNIGLVCESMDDHTKALSSYEKALKIWQQSLPPTHPNLATPYNNIGAVYTSMGDYRKALSSFEKALVISQQSLPPTHPDLAISYYNIGNVYHSMGDYPKALSSYEKALAIQQQSLPSIGPNLGATYSNIGLLYERTGHYAEALVYYEKALAIWQQSLPPTHPNLTRIYSKIALLRKQMSKYWKT